MHTPFNKTNELKPAVATPGNRTTRRRAPGRESTAMPLLPAAQEWRRLRLVERPAFVAPMRLHFLAFVLSAIVSSPAAEMPVPVRQEPHHKVALENNHVRVIDVKIPPGKTTLYHVHDVPSVIVYLTSSTVSTQTWGEASSAPRRVSPGESRYAAYDEKTLSHRVTNTGAELFRVLDIELVGSAPKAGPFPLVTPSGMEMRWEEKRVRSSQLRLASHGRCHIPASGCAHLLIVTSGTITNTPTRPGSAAGEQKAQEFVFFPPQTGFQLLNPHQEPAEAVLLELK